MVLSHSLQNEAPPTGHHQKPVIPMATAAILTTLCLWEEHIQLNIFSPLSMLFNVLFKCLLLGYVLESAQRRDEVV